jgi:hypothetical protein
MFTSIRSFACLFMVNLIPSGKRIISIFSVAMLSAAVGCGGGRTYVVDPEESSKAAIEQYDKNGDALLDETELKDCPALLRELRAYDESNDKKLSREEIASQINDMYQRISGLTAIACTVTLDGSPLSGATVKFIPEKFLGEEIKTAQGVTNNAGYASMSIPADELPKELRRTAALRAGIYRVEITHHSKKIPAKYNTESELGFEFHATDHIKPPMFNLKSK